MDIARLLKLELQKGQPDSFVVSQVCRALRLIEPLRALQVCTTLLSPRNLHAFRASWSTIMRGMLAIRSDPQYDAIASALDEALDALPDAVQHLLSVDTNCLHFLRAIRIRKTETRAKFVLATYSTSQLTTVRRACIECWRSWRDRDRFLALRNAWEKLDAQEQRLLWLAAGAFGDDGMHFKKQEGPTVRDRWSLGFEQGRSGGLRRFSDVYREWADQQT